MATDRPDTSPAATAVLTEALPPANPGIVREHLLRSLFSRVKPLLIANIGSAVMLTLLMLGATSTLWILLWAVTLSSWTFMRYVLAKTYLSTARSPSETMRWTILFAIGSGIGGTLWGTSVFFFSGFSAEEAKLPMALLMAALSAAALAGYSKNLTAFYAFILPALIPYGVTLAAVDAQSIWVAGFFAFWLLIIATMAHNLHAGFRDIVAHEVQRDEMIVRLGAARDEAEAASMAKTRFLANMSHELRTPLNAIIGFADMMVQKMLGPIGNASYEPYVDNISSSGNHLLKIVEEVLDVSRLEAGRIQLADDDIDLNELLGLSARKVHAQALIDELVLELDLPPDLPKVRADATKLRQIVVNLLSNSVKYTKPGGRICLSARQRRCGGVEIRVTDTGVGIPADMLPHVTRPFSHLERREHLERETALKDDRGQTSNGLGLPLVRLLTENHDGEFLLESRVGEGTVARVRMPWQRTLVGVSSRSGDRSHVQAMRDTAGRAATPQSESPSREPADITTA